MSLTVEVEGLADLLNALQELPKRATQKGVVRRSLTKSAEPIRGLWAALAPYDGSDIGMHYRDAVVISAKTKSRQTLENARPGDVTIYVGPDKNLPRHHGIFMEFGTYKDAAQPSGRPAWESKKDDAFRILGYWMWVEIDGSARRLAARAARLAKG
jgi:HK97 gp10 family phage protein